MFVGTWLPYSETFIYDQVQHQSRFRATAFARRRGGAPERFPYEHVVSLGPIERKLYEFWRIAPTFSRQLRAIGAKAAHAHFGTNGVLAMPFARALGIPLAVTFHGYDVGALLPQNKYTSTYFRYQRQAPAMFDYASLLLCASQELADMLLELGAPESKIVVHRLGIDLGRWNVAERSDGPVSVLMIGRLVEKKGMEYGIRAFAQVRRDHPDIRLRIVGEGPLGDELRALVRSLEVEDAVTFVGVLASEEVAAELARAHALLAPSVVAANGDRESGVIVIKEAGATGLPTIGTRHGGIPEIIDHETTGFLVPERDADALAIHLRTMIEDPAARARMGAAARAQMEDKYDTVRQNARFEELLASML
jgi:glycosyltransferase involved in cell wall biosynthesis